MDNTFCTQSDPICFFSESLSFGFTLNESPLEAFFEMLTKFVGVFNDAFLGL